MNAPVLRPEQSGVDQELLFQAMSDGVLSVDLDDGQIRGANQAMELITGHMLSALVGASLTTLAPENAGPHEIPFGREVVTREGLHDEVTILRADGFVASVSVRVAHAPDGHRSICIIRDTTARRMLERELITKHLALRSAHEELQGKQREISQLSARMAVVSRQALLSAVVAEVAHNINNPLAALGSSLRVLARGQASPCPDRERQRALIERCVTACDRLAKVVDELRGACRSAKPVGEAIVDLAQEAELAVAFMRDRMPVGVKLEFNTEPGLRVTARGDEIQYAVLNMLDNALHAAGPSGSVRIRVESTPEGALLVVSDSGAGIPEDLCHSIFEPFFTTKPAGSGTGLGLSMVRRMVTEHGGRVWVEAHGELGGASFFVQLPEARDE
ncbi:MAG: ATP-binding protein [Myxococcales bacterium]|nr:ATP-binding protein [Myxococcales bacterium]